MRDWAISLCCRVVRRNMHEALLFLHAVSKPNNNGLTPRVPQLSQSPLAPARPRALAFVALE